MVAMAVSASVGKNMYLVADQMVVTVVVAVMFILSPTVTRIR